MRLTLYGIKLKTNKLNIKVKPNQKINIEVDSARIATVSTANYNVDMKIITCFSCGGTTKVYNGKNAVCDYCGGKLNI